MALAAMQKIIKGPNYHEGIQSVDQHVMGKRVVGHQIGAINTPERLMQFNTQDLANERGGPASTGAGTNKSLVQFGGQ